MLAWLLSFVSLVLCLAASGPLVEGAALQDTEAQVFFDSIPSDEQAYFVSYALAVEVAKEDAPHDGATIASDDYEIKVPDDLAIPPDVLHRFETMEIPAGFTTGLYHWVRTEYSMSEREVTVLAVKAEYCFPDGHCVDVDDIGNTCCPF